MKEYIEKPKPKYLTQRDYKIGDNAKSIEELIMKVARWNANGELSDEKTRIFLMTAKTILEVRRFYRDGEQLAALEEQVELLKSQFTGQDNKPMSERKYSID
jgi:hypothetical protein